MSKCKKLFSFLLVLVLLLPSVSFADQDPIVGGWYICLDAADALGDYQEQGYTFDVIILIFTEKGAILGSDTAFKETSGESKGISALGKWEKDGDTYTSSIVGIGVNQIYLSDDLMAICAFDDSSYHLLRKMKLFSMYDDIKRK